MTAGSSKPRKWAPAPPALIATFGESVRALAGATQRMTFGYPAAYINGRLFAGIFQDSIVLKLPAGPRSELLKLAGASPFAPIPGRTMGEFIALAPALLKDRKRLLLWLRKACHYVKSLPQKQPEGRPGAMKQARARLAADRGTAAGARVNHRSPSPQRRVE